MTLPFPAIPRPFRLRRIDSNDSPFISRLMVDDREFLRVQPEALTLLAQAAFRDVNFLMRPERLAQIASILDTPEASEGDRLVAQMALDNAQLAARFEL
ncbi:MAG: fumarate hydratase, partial [Myxococcales bacterium]|nr:fumarate hydratase [Myxococcales bacterium]